MIRYLLILFTSIFVLTGCASSPNYNTLEVKEKEVIKIKIQEELLVPCIPEKPLSKENYLKLQLHERELYLTNYSKSLLLTIKDCNIKLQKIKEFQDKQQ
jgi:hypothetical protein